MQFRNVFFLVLFFFCSCVSKTPPDVLSADKMTAILTDLQLADAAYKLDMLPEAYKNHPEKYYLEILAIHNTDTTAYNRSMHYYAENPQLLKKIYTELEKNIKNQNN